MKPYFSYLRVFAAFAVILLHTSGFYVGHFEKYNFSVWNASNFLESFTRFCVPVFLMVTGALLLNKDEDLFVFLKKRYKRVLFPFIFWALIYIAFGFTSPVISVQNLKSIFTSFLRPVSFHFWYIYLILGLYPFIPILRKWTIQKNRKEILFFLAVWSFTLLINNKTRHFLPEIDLSYFTGSIGYLVLGHYLSNVAVFKNKKLWKWASLAVFLLTALVIFYLTQIYTLKYHRFFNYFYDGIFASIQAASFYIFILNTDLRRNKLVEVIDSNSYGIYLIHILVLNHAKPLFQHEAQNGTMQIMYLLLLSLSTFIISFLIIYLLRKVPFIKNFVG